MAYAKMTECMKSILPEKPADMVTKVTVTVIEICLH